jgi:hypothetical protein
MYNKKKRNTTRFPCDDISLSWKIQQHLFFSRVVDVLEETFRAKKEKKNKSKCNNINELHTHTREKDVGGIQFFFFNERKNIIYLFF